MLQEIAYYLIFGKPLIFYLGILTFLSLAATATIGYLIHHGKKIPFQFHKKMAAITIILAIIHGTMGILLYF